MLKLYDWECLECGHIVEHFIKVPDGADVPMRTSIFCCCGDKTEYIRMVSPPAKYLGDRPISTCVYGGTKDTAGYRGVPAYPELKDGVSWEDREGPGGEPRKTKVIKASALAEHQNSAEWREVHKAREMICDENAAKLSRLPALKAGRVNLRDTKAPGDPRLTEKRKATTNGRTKRTLNTTPRPGRQGRSGRS